MQTDHGSVQHKCAPGVCSVSASSPCVIVLCESSDVSTSSLWCQLCLLIGSVSDMTIAVDWALKNKYLSQSSGVCEVYGQTIPFGLSVVWGVKKRAGE